MNDHQRKHKYGQGSYLRSRNYVDDVKEYHEPPVDYTDDSDCEHTDRSNNVFDSMERIHRFGLSCRLPIIDFNRLQFENSIGQGGFGKVYRGRYNGYCVAIKEPIYYNHGLMNRINQAILDEAKLHYQLDHSNIIKLCGISVRADKIYLVMEYARGGSLRDLISKKTLSPNIIIKFSIEISSAVEYLHNFRPKAIIHRDLKSLNILLNKLPIEENWECIHIKLTDLGLAREFTNSTQMSQCGTYAWMAPETITDSKFSKASDVWSFGVVLWELLTGQIPYRDFSGPAIAFGIGNRKLTLPIPKTCPDELKQILQACWLQNAKQRPSFSEIREELEKSSFNVINLKQFQKMKQNWFDEIETIWKTLKKKEKELESREEEAKRKEEAARKKEEEIEKMKKKLHEQSEELKRREIEVVVRELRALLLQNQSKELKKRKTKNKHVGSNSQISYPQNFCHKLTVTTSPENYSIPILQALPLNQTWGPGTKIRPELHSNLFAQSRTSSKSQDLNKNETEYEPNNSHNKTHKKKNIRTFFKKIFRSSKSSLNKTRDCSNENLDQSVDGEQLEDDYEIEVDNFMLNQQFALNRTYHGQTKHSERQRISVLEHFQYQYDTDDQYSDVEESRECPDKIDLAVGCNHAANDSDSYPYSYVYANRVTDNCALAKNSIGSDLNNNNANFNSNHNCHNRCSSNNTNTKTGTSVSTSEHDFDDDLLLEFDKFEQEFQSMNGSTFFVK